MLSWDPKKELAGIDLKKIPWNQSIDVLKRMAACGTVKWQEKPVILDLFSRVPFHYEVTRNEKGELILSGYWSSKSPFPFIHVVLLRLPHLHGASFNLPLKSLIVISKGRNSVCSLVRLRLMNLMSYLGHQR